MKELTQIGVIAPSGPCSVEVVKEATAFFAGQGLALKFFQDVSAFYGSDQHLFSSDTVETRVRALQHALDDCSCQLILTARGGYGSMELLPSLNELVVKETSPLISGFSDATALLCGMYLLHGCRSLHGPSLMSFRADKKMSDKIQYLEALRGVCTRGWHSLGIPSEKLTFLEDQDFKAEGILLGGNLSVLAALCGIYTPPTDLPIIFFFEELQERPYRILRMITQLQQAGWMKNACAVVVGELTDCSYKYGPSAQEVVAQAFGPLNIPMVINAPFGHGDALSALPIGGHARLSLNGLEVFP